MSIMYNRNSSLASMQAGSGRPLLDLDHLWLLLSLQNIPLKLPIAVEVTPNFHNDTSKLSVHSALECGVQQAPWCLPQSCFQH